MERRLTETRYDGTGLPATRRLSDSGRLAGGQGGKEAGREEGGRQGRRREAGGRSGGQYLPAPAEGRPAPRLRVPSAAASAPRVGPAPRLSFPAPPAAGVEGGGGGCGGINPGLGGVRVSGFVKVSGWVRGER